jgi:transposase
LETALLSFDSHDQREVKILFQDEARFGRINEPVRCWAPPGVRPIVKKQYIREYIYVYASVCPLTGEVFSLIMPHCNTESMSIFIEELSAYYSDYKIIMFMDKAGWHTSKELIKKDNIRILHLPPYSPELNPTEHLWDHIREKYFMNQMTTSLDLLEKKLVNVLNIVESDYNTIKSLTYFNWLNLYN